ncbi:MAG: hypothetical protein HKM98_11160 [Gammaproteobacteria bacterium]|nr:hypothetical protein [Gammaproteobacteria bacterium]
MSFRLSKDDLDFRSRMEACELPLSEFDHRAHLRLAYIYLSGNDSEQALALMRASLHRFLNHNNIDPSKYHETITKAWILATHHFMKKTKKCLSANEFIDSNPEMLDPTIMMTHYSAEVLFSQNARETFVQPDLTPIPRYGD